MLPDAASSSAAQIVTVAGAAGTGTGPVASGPLFAFADGASSDAAATAHHYEEGEAVHAVGKGSVLGESMYGAVTLAVPGARALRTAGLLAAGAARASRWYRSCWFRTKRSS